MTATRELMEAAVEIAREAGKLLMSELPLGRWRGDVEHKGGRELVSRVDRAAEALIRQRIGEAFPTHEILGEEEGGAHQESATRWLVDPLDGTTNFLHGHPFFAVSLAVEAPSGELEAACVHLPYLQETYFGARGLGAFLNSETMPLTVSETDRLDDALVATGFAYDRERWPNYDNFVAMARASRGIRRCGAASVDLCFVAAGRYDAFWELGLRPWDVAAGALLVREAGGVVADFDGGDDWLEGGRIIASVPALFEPVRAQLRSG
jgi:myo-inositol-1(or 4)-monophosphatase